MRKRENEEKGCANMRCIILGGFLGSGKTTTIRKLVETPGIKGEKTAVIVNEIGEIGIDGDTVSAGGVETREITSGCICCTLRISLEQTLRALMQDYRPETVIIEPTGIAFPKQIKDNISAMNIPGISMAPIVNLLDASRFKPEEGLQNFIKYQIEDAEVLCINKVDLIDRVRLLEICVFLRKMNPKARIIHFSAREDGEIEELVEILLEGDTGSIKKSTISKSNKRGQMEGSASERTPPHDRIPVACRLQVGEKMPPEGRDSVEMSGVSAYSSEFEVFSDSMTLDDAIFVSTELLESIRSRARSLNPDFTGHIKLSFSHLDTLIRGSVTSAASSPEIEIFKKGSDTGLKMKVFSAVTDVSQKALSEAINEAVTEQFEKGQTEIKKVWHAASSSHEH
ncbi:Putative metal chaperone, involved in Zn homeostasis, GTPase of COG0523 family [Methanosarcina siciliae C2J]|uniref:Putative metal chaperone, involved in Zn homeostasis, GTPase of COG0523 family n=2 Tax=Methanosarcina siciliae TaxID=38027 RepID=A0A0E3PU18_9EURY|nr:Putative metal chaperone, involved in Zn homeostasis, GTPase of COG0523 family [Methanosarcina siciliae C2J]